MPVVAGTVSRAVTAAVAGLGARSVAVRSGVVGRDGAGHRVGVAVAQAVDGTPGGALGALEAAEVHLGSRVSGHPDGHGVGDVEVESFGVAVHVVWCGVGAGAELGRAAVALADGPVHYVAGKPYGALGKAHIDAGRVVHRVEHHLAVRRLVQVHAHVGRAVRDDVVFEYSAGVFHRAVVVATR